MVADARTRADEAEARLADALERAEQARRDAEEHARTLLSNARHNADDIVSQAREHAETIISEAVTDAERERTLASTEVEELNRQRESITTYLDDLRIAAVVGSRSTISRPPRSWSSSTRRRSRQSR